MRNSGYTSSSAASSTSPGTQYALGVPTATSDYCLGNHAIQGGVEQEYRFNVPKLNSEQNFRVTAANQTTYAATNNSEVNSPRYGYSRYHSSPQQGAMRYSHSTGEFPPAGNSQSLHLNSRNHEFLLSAPEPALAAFQKLQQPPESKVQVVVHCTPHPSGCSATDSPNLAERNPLLNVSSDYIRILSLRRPFEKFLSSRKSSNVVNEVVQKKKSSKKQKQKNGSIGSRKSRKHSGNLENGSALFPGETTSFHLDNGSHHHGNSLLDPPVKSTSRAESVSASDWRLEALRRRSTIREKANAESRKANLKYRFGLRRRLYHKRSKICDFKVFFAILGILITVADSELCASQVISKVDAVSIVLRTGVLLTTIVLAVLIILYHSCEIQLDVIDSGADDWRVAMTWRRICKIVAEELICIWCPLPGTGQTSWAYIVTDSCSQIARSGIEGGLELLPTPGVVFVAVPTDTLLTIPMFMRCYILGRYMVLNSHQFRDAATRSIAALNRISVDFKFVLKTMMHVKLMEFNNGDHLDNPLMVLVIFAVAYWVSVSWVFSMCERNSLSNLRADHHYLNALWFVIVTFLTIGYGDTVPNTYCGRVLAVTTGLVGAGVSSALIAVISRKLDLTKAEKHVNAFMADSKLAKERKNVAARVLQETWFIYKFRYLNECKDEMKIRLHQRRFIAAMTQFRRIKWEQRKLAEQSNMLVDIAKVQADMTDVLWEIQQSHRNLALQLTSLNDRLTELQDRQDRSIDHRSVTSYRSREDSEHQHRF